MKLLTIHLPMQGAQVHPPVWEDPICHEANKPVCHNHWDSALEPLSCNHGPTEAHMPRSCALR